MKQLIGAVLKEAAVTDTVVGTLFDEMDDDGNGVVDWREFATYFDLSLAPAQPPVLLSQMSGGASPRSSPRGRRSSSRGSSGSSGGGPFACCGSPKSRAPEPEPEPAA